MTTLHESAAPNAAGYRDVTPSQVFARARHVHVVDVREPHELAGELGRIADAEHVPLATVLAAAPAWPKDAELVLVCRSGARSSQAATALTQRGFRRIMNMTGGMLAWNDAGLPIERG
ncbi:MAG: rhodanese-like domain-containing protein [Labilithrix sp.]|nr:rhodanese-like domain-containing protein [Labilithrix sp.]MCW5812660.1 rhodanese-like domain-containing protein [Labilithrix sp.]